MSPPARVDGARSRGGRAATAYVGLGSNLGDREENLAAAVQAVACPGAAVTACSPLYETEPVGPVKDQPPFLNAVMELRTTLSPRALLERCLQVEDALGRDRASHPPKGPRLIDLDLLLYEDLVIREPGLTVPHPELRNRSFVLVPLLDLAPDLKDPSDGTPLKLLPAASHPTGRVDLYAPPPSLPPPAVAGDEVGGETAGKDTRPAGPGEDVNLFTVSALRLHMPRRLPPTPGRRGRPSWPVEAARALWHRLARGRGGR